jgi:transcriptional regulator with XRE-family HTH domain
MPLTIAERKYLMPFGAQIEVARAESVSESYVSAVMSDAVEPKTPPTRKKLRRVQVALARKLGRPVDDVFPAHAKHEAATAAA